MPYCGLTENAFAEKRQYACFILWLESRGHGPPASKGCGIILLLYNSPKDLHNSYLTSLLDLYDVALLVLVAPICLKLFYIAFL
jgi:hypothetical protein